MSWRTSAQAAICVLSSRRPHASVVMVAGSVVASVSASLGESERSAAVHEA